MSGGNDIARDGEWRWGSCEQVESFIWDQSQPDGGTDHNCLYLQHNYHYLGGDMDCGLPLHHICQTFRILT